MFRYSIIAFVAFQSLFTLRLAMAQEPAGLINFDTDIRPILAAKCVKCHGDKRANNDFRVDEEDSLLSYIEAGEDAEESILWSDYLATDDVDLKMPPAKQTQLTGSELATIKLWIEEGAHWEDPQDTGDASAESTTDVANPKTKSFFGKVWFFQGLFHPAAVHFPLGLLSASPLFLLLSFKFGDNFRSAAFHCLWLGALGAVVACVLGWSYAQYEGYGAFGFDVINSPVDRHRWIGIFVAVLSLITVPVAKSAFTDPENNPKQKRWLMASLLIGLCVGATGYMGGELSYGNNHYEKEFRHLFLDDQGASEEASLESADVE